MIRYVRPRPSVESRARRSGRWRATGILAVLSLVLAIVGLHSSVRAQDGPGPLAAGITVVGYGEASASAETADLQILVSSVNFGGPVAPNPKAVPGEAERESVGPLVEGLIAAGIPEDDIVIVVSPILSQYYGPSGPGVARVDVAVDGPTRERIDELLSAAVVGAAEENLVVGQVGVGYGVDDCAKLDREAREAAFSDAESRADRQAEVMGVSRGAALASSDVPVGASSFDPYFGLSSSQAPCAPSTPDPAIGASVSFPAYDPTSEAEVSVYAQVAVTFAIDVADGEATPTA